MRISPAEEESNGRNSPKQEIIGTKLKAQKSVKSVSVTLWIAIVVCTRGMCVALLVLTRFSWQSFRAL